MSKFQRIGEVLVGVLMLASSVAMALFPKMGYLLILLFLSLSLIAAGIRGLVYYARMARHMVGGIAALFRGLIILDLGLFTASLADVPQFFVMLYLLGMHAFLGFVDIMRALEARGYKSPTWRMSIVHGVINIVLAVGCAVFISSLEMMVYIYALGLAYSAAMRIYTAFRRDAIVYIQ